MTYFLRGGLIALLIYQGCGFHQTASGTWSTSRTCWRWQAEETAATFQIDVARLAGVSPEKVKVTYDCTFWCIVTAKMQK